MSYHPPNRPYVPSPAPICLQISGLRRLPFIFKYPAKGSLSQVFSATRSKPRWFLDAPWPSTCPQPSSWSSPWSSQRSSSLSWPCLRLCLRCLRFHSKFRDLPSRLHRLSSPWVVHWLWVHNHEKIACFYLNITILRQLAQLNTLFSNTCYWQCIQHPNIIKHAPS